MKRTLAGVVATMLAAGGMLVATAAPSSAHDNAVEASCSALTVDLDRYSTGNTRWSKHDGHRDKEHGDRGNSLTVVVGGVVVEDLEDFGTDYHRTFPLDGTKPTAWSVVVDAADEDRYDIDESGTTTPCQTPVPSKDIEVQVGLYLYPKLHEGPAAWENSGKQELLGTKSLTVAADELDDLVRAKEYWFTELPADSAFVDVAEADLCRGWGIQQDLLLGGPTEYEMPQNITYPDGSLHDENLIDWTHQELSDFGIELPTAEDCAAPPVPEEPEVEQPEVVVPVAPGAVEVCGATADDVVLPESTEQITYTRSEQGVVATPTEGNVFGDDLGGYTRTVEGELLFPVTELLPFAEDCELVPGDIGAVCVGDTPYLDYGVSLPEGVEADGDTPLTITFLHPDGGEDYVATDQPLDGQLLWPGASETAPKQWPGWEQQDDGSYTETDGNYAWTRDGVQVLFEVNPDYSTVVEYPEASTECANPAGVGGADVEVVADDADVPAAETAEQAEELPKTGATVGVFAGLAALLLVGGGVLFWLRRRIQH